MKLPTPTVCLLISTLLLTGCASVDRNTANQTWNKNWSKHAYTANNLYTPVPPENTQYSGDTSTWAGHQRHVAVENIHVGIVEQDYIGHYYGI